MRGQRTFQVINLCRLSSCGSGISCHQRSLDVFEKVFIEHDFSMDLGNTCGIVFEKVIIMNPDVINFYVKREKLPLYIIIDTLV